MFEIRYASIHKDCTLDETGHCWCVKRGFTSQRMAAIYAFHHIMCRGCKKDINLVLSGHSLVKHYTRKEHYPVMDLDTINFLQEEETRILNCNGDLEDLWYESNCSFEWYITESPT